MELSTKKQIHVCCSCGRIGTWTEGWTQFSSIFGSNAGLPSVVACSTPCQTSKIAADKIKKYKNQVETAKKRLNYPR